MNEWQIVKIDPHALDESAWEQAFALYDGIFQEVNPEDPPRSHEQHRSYWLSPHPMWRDLRWLAYEPASGKLAGSARLGYFAENSPSYPSSRHVGMIGLDVAAEFRRRGLGTELLKTVIREACARGFTVFEGWFQLECGRRFWEHYGAQVCSERTRSRAYFERMDRALLENWAAEGARRSPGARVERYDSIPDEIIAEYARAYTAISAQTPDSDGTGLPLVPIITPDELRATEQLVREKGMRWITMVSREADGTISGLTEVYYAFDQPHLVDQDLTGVLREYRGRGLGKWLKAEMALYLMDTYPAARFIETGNNNGNAPMLAINRQMGFRPHITEALFKAEIAPLAARLGI